MEHIASAGNEDSIECAHACGLASHNVKTRQVDESSDPHLNMQSHCVPEHICLTFCTLGNSSCFLPSADFNFQNNSFKNTI